MQIMGDVYQNSCTEIEKIDKRTTIIGKNSLVCVYFVSIFLKIGEPWISNNNIKKYESYNRERFNRPGIYWERINQNLGVTNAIYKHIKTTNME